MTGFNSKRDAAADKDALFEKFEVAQPAQEPVAFICQGNLYMAEDVDKYCTATHISLYTAPPKRPWVGLTDEEMYLNCPNWLSQDQCKKWVEAIEAKLKEKNT